MSGKSFFSAFFEKHHAGLRRQIAARFKIQHEVDDIVQDAFHNLLRAQNIEELENPAAYLYQTASNLALNRIRKQRNHTRYIEQQLWDEDAEFDFMSPERHLLARKDLSSLDAAMEKLPEKFRRTFLLSRVQEKTYKEISELLEISESTVEKHIIKVLKHLRENLSEEVE